MRANRFVAILVFVAAAGWVLTGQFSFVGSATGEGNQPATIAEQTAREPAQPLQSVAVANIPQIEYARTVRVSGVTRADKSTLVTARSSGVLEKVAIRKGEEVAEAQLLARIAPEGRDAAVTSAEAAVEQARAEFDAGKQLVERGTLPRLQYKQVEASLRLAQSRYQTAVAELERLSVTAPFAGIMDTLPVEQGGAVEQGTVIGNLIALDPIIGVGEVNESDIGVLSVGGTAQLRLVTGKTLEGKIRFISRDADPTTRTYTVEVAAPNADLSVPAGMTANLVLRGPKQMVTPVPRSILTLNDAGDLGVRGVNGDHEVVFYPIDLVDDSTEALMLGGIPANVRIIVVGQNLVTDGQKVKPEPADNSVVSQLIAEARNGALNP